MELITHSQHDNRIKKERRRLHRQIAEVLEELYGDQTADIAVALAYHYREAGDEVMALPYLVPAGDYARDLYANEEAEG